jgi:hypothetical protein
MPNNPNDPNPQFRPGEPRRSGPPRPQPANESDPFRFDEGEPDVVRRHRRNWLDDQFGGTAIWVLVLFAFCCGLIAFAFGLAGVIGCNDPRAKRNALIVLIVSISIIGVQLMGQFAIAILEGMQKGR